MTVKLRHLHYFVTVVESGSFSRAAATIHIAQPALSRQIIELEELVGAALLHRTARGVRATPAGEVLYREATSILRQMERLPELVRSAEGDIDGTVVVGMSSTLASFLAGMLLDTCRQAYPKIRLRLVTADSIQIKARVDAGQIDIAVIFEDAPSPGYRRVPLFRQRLYLVRRDLPQQGEASVQLARLADIGLMLPSLPNVTRILLDRVFADAGLVPNMVGEADVLSSMLSAVQSGIGDTVVPMGDLSHVPGHASLVAVPIEPALHLTATMLSAADGTLARPTMLVRALLARLVFEQMSERPSPGAEWIGDESLAD